MSDLRYVDLYHDCERPSTEHLPSWGERGQVVARWRCPECGQRWQYAHDFLASRNLWSRVGRASWRWRRAEARRLREASRGR